MIIAPAAIVLALAVALVLYTYAGYPIAVWALAKATGEKPAADGSPDSWPSISIVLAAYNEEQSIAATLDSLLAVDYPADRCQVLVISDASHDGTDAIVAGYAERGVELLRLERRHGKTAAENAAIPHLEGEIIVNTDASVRMEPGAVKRLVTALADPEVGVASGRDISVTRTTEGANVGESRYVSLEMRLRAMETRAGGIVGASGCLYAIRRELHAMPLPGGLSRDFAAVLNARQRGFRAVSVDDAICYVPRGASLRREYHRKVRTMARGLATLLHKRGLLNPFRYGRFAWMLFSHKLCRWLVPWAGLAALAALVALAGEMPWAVWALAFAGLAAAAGALGWAWPRESELPRALALPSYVVVASLAALHAWARVLGGRRSAVWEPTRRGALDPS